MWCFGFPWRFYAGVFYTHLRPNWWYYRTLYLIPYSNDGNYHSVGITNMVQQKFEKFSG
jgi:hypothetical protein